MRIIPVSGLRAGVEKKEQAIEGLREWVLDHVGSYTAGSPTDESVKWTALRAREIVEHIQQQQGVRISCGCVKRILKAAGYVRRKPLKSIATGSSPHRQEQFRIILFLVALFNDMEESPILSIDTKKKELLGELSRHEAVLTTKQGVPKVYSSDYPYLANGRAVPHGIYDVKLNKGYISLGNSNETADFVVDNLAWWWVNFGQHHYQNATHILMLCDSGGANGHRHHRFKVLLQKLAKKIGIRIVVAHYPPYCSKYNPIERKLFCHLHRTIQNTILTSLAQLKQLMQKTYAKGLNVVVRVVEKDYPLKMPSEKRHIDEKRILRHPQLPQFSYTLIP